MRVRPSHFLLCVLAAGTCAFGQAIHYLDCSAGSDSADSLTPSTAWRSVAKASAFTYQPGDSLLLRRSTRCEGMLWPKGSGNEHASIYLGAYGKGALPVIAGGPESAGLRLSNQQYWEIENLEVVGGSPYGIHIGGSAPEMRHFRITNVVVHDVTGTPLNKDSGLVVIAPDDNAKSRIDDVIVDGVTAYGTSEWAGIIVNGAGFDSADGQEFGDRIEVRNSIVHDVAGDGILLARVAHGVLEHNVAWYTGMQEKETIGTPNAIWEWRCKDCRVEYNEAYFTDSPGVVAHSISITAMRTICSITISATTRKAIASRCSAPRGQPETRSTARFVIIHASTTAAVRGFPKDRAPSFSTHGTAASSMELRSPATPSSGMHPCAFLRFNPLPTSRAISPIVFKTTP